MNYTSKDLFFPDLVIIMTKYANYKKKFLIQNVILHENSIYQTSLIV